MNIGQFLTPVRIARFMASLFEQEKQDVRILDAGAGAGVLFTSLLETILNRNGSLRSIKIIAYENDKNILAYLHQAMTRCEMLCGHAGILFKWDIRNEDFIQAAIHQTETGFFTEQQERFTHAILNPPYKKINSETTTRHLLNSAGIEVSNYYAAFVWLAAQMLEPNGEMVAITPRSFCNGPYFRKFRINFLKMMSLNHIHIFESRKNAFGDDDVLQENVIYHAVRRSNKPDHIILSSSDGLNFDEVNNKTVPYKYIVNPDDHDAFIRLLITDTDELVMKRMDCFTTSLTKLGLEVSTGRVVDFRAQEYLRALPEKDTVPLIYPCHFENGFIHWPTNSGKKPNAIISTDETRSLLIEPGYYVLTRRFSAKEERRRIVAAVFDPNVIKASLLGFENHLNYFHEKGKGLPPELAKGLCLYLNSTLVDQYFRLFSGHTQVNATDLRKLRYPTCEQLLRLGSHIQDQIPDQQTIDALVEKECCNND
ncbi:MAG TPA: Eco57I restriction-modification methylase domain-containing protein [bacterium]|nr:Eco57I restriction-modification methylase domain-containing protein [bacterium]HPN42858.1 Eco57I restriction-modification methylase domain-containing protein [bacterium]